MTSTQLIADGGSTKTDWLLIHNQNILTRRTTRGLNPMLLNEDQIAQFVRTELLTNPLFAQAGQINYYGAGCRDKGSQRMHRALQTLWPLAEAIEVDSDLKGAARALLPSTNGIACILGTGSNSGLYIDGQIVQNTPPLGYLLGDEGSGAVLGRLLIGNVLKKQFPTSLCRAFESKYGLTADEIIERVYRQPQPNRFLASFAPFLYTYREEEAVHHLLITSFSAFFTRNIDAYNRHDLPVSFVGSIAYYFNTELHEAANVCHYHIDRIMQSPLDAFCANLNSIH